MRTYKLYTENRHFFAFEIENVYISSKKIKALLSAIDGVSDVRLRKLFSSHTDVHVQFKFQDNDFIVLEPYGDNSRYWIGPDNAEKPLNINIAPLEATFKEYKPQLLVKLFGDLISLNFKSIFSRE